MASGERAGDNQARFYLWQAPGNGILIHLNVKVVEALTAEHLRAMQEGTEQGIRGVLLGRSVCLPRPATFIEDFALIPEIESGDGLLTSRTKQQSSPFVTPLFGRFQSGQEQPRPAGSAHDLAELVHRLHQGVERGRNAIGFFRCQWEGELRPSKRDLKLAHRLFSEPEDVMLLVRFARHGEAEGGFLYWQDGKLRKPDFAHTFPFDFATLSRRAQIKRQYDDALPGWPRTPNLKAPPARLNEGFRWWQLLPTMALFTVGTLLAQNAFETGQVISVSPSTGAVTHATGLGLKAVSRANKLEIRWNHDSYAVRAAARAEMTILENGVVTASVPIDRSQLINGYVSYAPLTREVSIKMEITQADGATTSESLRAAANPGTK